MIPSSKSVLDLAECYLCETLASGWKARHPIQAVKDHHLDARGGTVQAKSSKPARQARILYPDYSGAAALDLLKEQMMRFSSKKTPV